ncbi:MAG: SulP family inorganic anion transporter [Elusimicrobiota bacterium]
MSEKIKKFSNKLKRTAKFFTIFGWLEDYNLKKLGKDIQSGVTIGIILIPQSMAYAMIAGVPPVYGLYACILPLMIYPLFGTSRHILVSTIAIDMVIIASGVGSVATPGTERYILLVTLLALLVGLIQILMFSLKLGFLVNYISRPVITGFAMAAAMIIVAGQLGSLLGIETGYSPYFYEVIAELVSRIGSINFTTLIVGGASLLFLIIVKLWKPMFPGYLFVLIVGILAGWGLDLPQQGVGIVGEIPSGFSGFSFPALTLSNFRDLLSTAMTLALVQFMTISTLAKTYATRHRYPIDPNQELLSLGLGNIVNGFFKAMPVSASFSCSAVNEQTGSETALTHVFAATVILLTLIFLTPLFYYLPYASLAAVVIGAAVNLIDFKSVKFLYKTKRRDSIIAGITFITTLIIGIQEGILLGVVASLLALLYRQSNPNVVELGHLSGTRSFKDMDRFSDAHKLEKILILRIDASFSFNNVEVFKEYIFEKSRNHDDKLEAVIVDGSAINDLDTTALDAIEMIRNTLEKWDVEFYITGLKGPVRDVLKRAGLYEKMGKKEYIFRTPHRAVLHILDKWDQKNKESDRLGDYQQRIEKDRE